MIRARGETGIVYSKTHVRWVAEEAVSLAPGGRRAPFPPYPVSPEPEDLTEPSEATSRKRVHPLLDDLANIPPIEVFTLDLES